MNIKGIIHAWIKGAVERYKILRKDREINQEEFHVRGNIWAESWKNALLCLSKEEEEMTFHVEERYIMTL